MHACLNIAINNYTPQCTKFFDSFIQQSVHSDSFKLIFEVVFVSSFSVFNSTINWKPSVVFVAAQFCPFAYLPWSISAIYVQVFNCLSV